MGRVDREKYPKALREGTVLCGKYIIEDVVGQGGFGITYKALDRSKNRMVAIKEYFPQSMAGRGSSGVIVEAFTGELGRYYEDGKGHFIDEARMLHALEDVPGVVNVRSYFEENKTAYFVMEYLEGQDMQSMLNERKSPFDWLEAIRLFLPVMDALSAVHSKGIYHRDLKPENIFITKDGQPKVIDFGTARYILGNESRSLDVILTHGYAPKEQYMRRGRQGAFTDVYALAASYYYAITRRVPPDSIDRAEDDELIPPRTLGVPMTIGTEDVLLKALSVSSSDRYQSMGEFKSALLNSPADTGGKALVYDRLFPGNAPKILRGDSESSGYGYEANEELEGRADAVNEVRFNTNNEAKLGRDTVIGADKSVVSQSEKEDGGEKYEDVTNERDAGYKEYARHNENIWYKGDARAARDSGIKPAGIKGGPDEKSVDDTGRGNQKKWWKSPPVFVAVAALIVILLNLSNLGQNTGKDKDGTEEQYIKILEQGDAEEQYNLGLKYDNGDGVIQDYAKAVELYKKAADQGYADAQVNLGFMYENGYGVARDYAKAVEWYEKAAEQGDANAQYNLGVMYYNGDGVARDYAKAVEWYQKAAENGSEEAKEKLKEIGG